MKAEITTENKPVWVSFEFGDQCGVRKVRAHEDEERFQILIVLLRMISVQPSRFPAACSEEIGFRIVSSQQLGELLESGMDAT